MGNINNPEVNRWGINLFWYHFWYSNKNYTKRVYQDKLLIILIKVYLKYGLQVSKNIFFNYYWFKIQNRSFIDKRYYRWSIFKDLGTEKEIKYKFRTDFSLFYKTKFVVLRYDNWVIIVTQWFTPTKGNTLVSSQNNIKNFQNFFSPKTGIKLARLNLNYIFQVLRPLNFQNYYNF